MPKVRAKSSPKRAKGSKSATRKKPARRAAKHRKPLRIKPLGRPGAATLPSPPDSAPDYADRLRRLMAAASLQGLDHLVITNPVDVGYLTGFLGGDSNLLLGPACGPKDALIITDGRYEEELGAQRSLAEILVRTKSMAAATAEVIAGARVHRCGIQADHLSVAERDALVRVLSQEDGGKLVATSGLVSRLREVKDAHEIELMQTATQIQEAALQAILPSITPGQTELEIAALLEMEMKRRGSSRCWFDSIVGVGASAALPHYRPGPGIVRRNDIVLIDWGSTFMGYAGDMTRTFALGAWPAKMREVYQIVREAQETAAAALAPGKMAHQIDAIAREIITRHGYGPQFNHGLGHGLGMSKEPPYLNPLWPDMELKPGHVVTVEPGIYLPGVGGVRIEDLYVITQNGARNLSSLPKTIEWSTL